MTPGHPRWTEFVETLSHACICIGSVENARQTLSAMPGIDVARSLEALGRLGGVCDCAIVFDLAKVPRRVPA